MIEEEGQVKGSLLWGR